MKKFIYLLLILLNSCTQNRTLKDDYCDVINLLLKSDLAGNDLLILDTEPVRLDTIPDHNIITLRYLELYTQKGFLQREDITHIVNQINSLNSIRLDSTKFEIKTMTKNKINDMFTSMGFDSALNYLNNQKIIKIASVSTPLYSVDRTVMIFWVKEWINPLNSQGYIFIFKKEKHKWKMIESGVTFES
jgi:hypothetical protein